MYILNNVLHFINGLQKVVIFDEKVLNGEQKHKALEQHLNRPKNESK